MISFSFDVCITVTFYCLINYFILCEDIGYVLSIVGVRFFLCVLFLNIFLLFIDDRVCFLIILYHSECGS